MTEKVKSKKDITKLVEFGSNDGDSLPLTKCVCGKKWDYWDFVLHADKEYLSTCSGCGRKMYFEVTIRIIEAEWEI